MTTNTPKPAASLCIGEHAWINGQLWLLSDVRVSEWTGLVTVKHAGGWASLQADTLVTVRAS